MDNKRNPEGFTTLDEFLVEEFGEEEARRITEEAQRRVYSEG
jgi:hypothetical protein